MWHPLSLQILLLEKTITTEKKTFMLAKFAIKN